MPDRVIKADEKAKVVKELLDQQFEIPVTPEIINVTTIKKDEIIFYFYHYIINLTYL